MLSFFLSLHPLPKHFFFFHFLANQKGSDNAQRLHAQSVLFFTDYFQHNYFAAMIPLFLSRFFCFFCPMLWYRKEKRKKKCNGDDFAQVEIFVLVFWSALTQFSDFGDFVFNVWWLILFSCVDFFFCVCLTVGVAGWEVDYWRLPREAVTCPIVGLAKVRWGVA